MTSIDSTMEQPQGAIAPEGDAAASRTIIQGPSPAAEGPAPHAASAYVDEDADDDEYDADETDPHFHRTVPQRAASSMSRAQWEDATSRMRAISVGGEDLAQDDEADVAAALASLDVPAGVRSVVQFTPAQEPRTTMLPQGAAGSEPRTTMLNGRGAAGGMPSPEPRTTMLDRAGAPLTRGPAQSASGSTMVAPPTIRRDAPLSRPPVASQPYEDGAYVREPRYSGREERYGAPSAAASVGAGILSFIAIVLRLAAIALIVLIILNAIPVGLGNWRVHIVNLMARVDDFIPPTLSGRLALQTVFGGTFRGDLALVSLCLFIFDWLLSRVAHSLRESR